jgi:dTDP-4-amino-4,6-dideoxygalactose transaminase
MGNRLRTLLAAFREVPWGVPSWGRAELRATVGAVLGGRVGHGPDPDRLAQAVRQALGVRFALPVNRGRTAIELAAKALGAGPGGEVVLPSYICRSVLEAVERTGARPVFADLGDGLHLSAETVAAVLSPRSRCVIVPHLDGKAAPIAQIEALLQGTGVGLIDDAAQALGASCGGRLVGTFGQFGILSCGGGKPLSGASGGLLVTSDPDLFERAATLAARLEAERAKTVLCRNLSCWVWRRLRRWTLPAWMVLDRLVGLDRPTPHVNATLANLDAALMLRQLEALQAHAEQRRRHFRRLAPLLQGVAEAIVANDSEQDVATRLVVILPAEGLSMTSFLNALSRAGIEASPGYEPLHRAVPGSPSLPRLEAIAGRIVWIPLDRPANPRRLAAALARLPRPGVALAV